MSHTVDDAPLKDAIQQSTYAAHLPYGVYKVAEL